MHRHHLVLTTTAALCAAALVPAAAQAAKPAVTALAPDNVSQTTADLRGRIDPNGEITTYVFQYGPTTSLGKETAPASAGSGGKVVGVRASIAELKPKSRVYYRLVASNPSGTTRSPVKNFATKAVPLALSFAATPNPVKFGATTTLFGTLSGTGGGGREVQLEAKGFPYSAAFAKLGNAVVTNSDGTFGIPVPGLTTNTQMRVRTTDGKLSSPAVIVGVSPVVRTAVSTTRPRRGSRIRFAGTVTPSWVPAQVAVQKRTSDGRWVVVGGTVTRTMDAGKARYAVRVKVPRGGSYRVFVGLPDSKYTAAIGREVKVRAR